MRPSCLASDNNTSSPELLASLSASGLDALISHKERRCLRLGKSQDISSNFFQPLLLLELLCCGLFFQPLKPGKKWMYVCLCLFGVMERKEMLIFKVGCPDLTKIKGDQLIWISHNLQIIFYYVHVICGTHFYWKITHCLSEIKM